MDSKRFALLAGVLLAAAVFAAHGPALSNGFLHFDDPVMLTENPNWDGSLRDAAKASLSEVRNHAWLPLYLLAYLPEVALLGEGERVVDHPFPFHLASLLWHLVGALLVCRLLLRLGLSRFLALGAATLFAVHPVACESVAWASGRKDQVSLVLMLLAMLATLRWYREGANKQLGLAALFGILACFAKSSVIVFPATALVLGLFLRARGEEVSKARLRPAALVLGGAAVIPLVVHFVIAASEGAAGAAAGHGPLTGFRFFLQALSAYLRHLALPYDLSIHYHMDVEGGFGMGALFGAVILGVLVAASVLLARGGKPLAGLVGAWILVSLLPFNDVFPRTSVPMADRYLILGLPFFGLALAALARRLPGKSGVVALALCTLAFAFLARGRSAEFENGERVFRRAMEVDAKDPLPPLMVGDALLLKARAASAGRSDASPEVLVAEALGLFGTSASLSKEPVLEIRARLRLADTLLKVSRYQAAYDEFSRLEQLAAKVPGRLDFLGYDPALIAYQKAQSLMGQKRLLEAREVLEGILENTPGHRWARLGLAELELDAGFSTLLRENVEDAVRREAAGVVDRVIAGMETLLEEERKKAAADDSFAKTFEVALRRKLGRAYLRARWNPRWLTRALSHSVFLRELDPDGADGYVLHAEVLQAMGASAPEIEFALVKAWALAPTSLDIGLRLARHLRGQGQKKRAIALLLSILERHPEYELAAVECADIFLGEAHLQRNNKNPKKAFVAVSEALRLDPNSIDARVLLGEIHELEGRVNEARSAYEAVWKDQEGHVGAGRGLGRLHQAHALKLLGNLDRLVAAGVKKGKGSEEELRKQLVDRVLLAYRLAVKFGGDSDDVRIARRYLRQADHLERRKKAREILALAKAAMGRQEGENAFGLLQQAVKIDATDIESQVLLAVAARATGHTDEALKAAEAAVALDPTHPRALYELTVIAYVKGKDARALEVGKRFIDQVKLRKGEKLLGEELQHVQEILGRLSKAKDG